MTAQDPLLVVLLGPTASGKTALSLALAQRFGGEIVSCDSVAVYREMEIGTAKPSSEDRRLIPHHLLDVVSIAEHYTAGDYSRAARAAIAGITARRHLPIVTGGTGLYLRALIDGLFAGPERSESLRQRLRLSNTRHPPGWLHRILSRLDPNSATRIHANDTPKLIRAIEVCVTGQKPISSAWRSGRDRLTGYRILRIGLDPDRKLLYARINSRAEKMFESGLIEETEDLLRRYKASARPLTSLGYRQAMSVIQGAVSREEAIRTAQQGHRNYAKRQMTWFRREPGVHWIEGFGDDPAIAERAIELVRASL